jgi:hypothetical protein
MRDPEDILREATAVIKVACTHCHAPVGYHCASVVASIVWPPHLCRMDAYTHRLDPSEDWPQATLALASKLDYVKTVPAPYRHVPSTPAPLPLQGGTPLAHYEK